MCGTGINNLHVPGCAQNVANTVYTICAQRQSLFVNKLDCPLPTYPIVGGSQYKQRKGCMNVSITQIHRGVTGYRAEEAREKTFDSILLISTNYNATLFMVFLP